MNEIEGARTEIGKCPFCGSDDLGPSAPYGERDYQICCGTCGACGPEVTANDEIELAYRAFTLPRAPVVAPAASEAMEKLRHLTDPNADCTSDFVGYCIICNRDEPYTYHVPESLWRKILPEDYWHEIVCAKCFDEIARERAAKKNGIAT